MSQLDQLLAEADEIVNRLSPHLNDNGEFNETVLSYYSDEKIAKVTDPTGYPILRPHPESASILVGMPIVFELLVRGTRIIRDLAEIARNQGNSPDSEGNDA